MRKKAAKKANGISETNGKFYLRKSIRGKQHEVSLDTDSLKTAKERATRFIATATESGYETAIAELRGREIVKKGDDPTLAKMELLYRDYCKQSAKPPREPTIKQYVGSLRRLMGDCKTVSKFEPKKLIQGVAGKTLSQKRSFASEIRNASSIFKKKALAYYHERGVKLSNPFEGIEIERPKVEAYVPITDKSRGNIWIEAKNELPANEAMIVLLALGAGLRRSEIEACRLNWFSPYEKRYILTVQEVGTYQTKSGRNRTIPIPTELYEEIMELRSLAIKELSEVAETQVKIESTDFVIPVIQKKGSGIRLWGRFAAVIEWIKSKGITGLKPLHTLRKEYGSIVAAHFGIYEASKLLGHQSVQVTQDYYAGLLRTPDLDVGSIILSGVKNNS